MPKSKWVSFFLCLFFGLFGAHKFYEGRILLGILYICTAGLDKKVIAYIKSLSKDELRQTLYEVLYDGADWAFERFVREHIDY